jgi:hypothetical protein
MPSEKNIKDTERTSSISFPNTHSNPFGHNISGDKAYRRAERIVAALYILTKHVSDTEPLYMHVRSSGHALLKDILKLRTGFRVDPDAADISQLHARVREMISFTQLLSVAGHVSKENVDMVTRALEELSQFVEAAGSTQLAERTTFTKEDLLIDNTTRASSLRTFEAPHKKHQKTHTAVSTQQKQTAPNKGQMFVSDNMSSRRTAVLEVLKDGKRIGIKDISSFVVGCSEKTVQRELAALVSDGLIQKEGEKRWSRYFIV